MKSQQLHHMLSVSDKETENIELLCQQMARAIEIMRARKTWAARLRRVIRNPSIETMIALGEHSFLMEKFLLCHCRHFSDLGEAISVMSEDKILVHITELHLYGVFTVPEYVEFLNNLYGGCGLPVSYVSKQVSISGFPQKIVFMCANDEQIIGRVADYCELYFKSTVRVNSCGNETNVIIENILVKDLEQAKKWYAEFVDYVNSIEDVRQFGLRMEVKRSRNVEYIENLMGDHSKVYDVDGLLKYLNGHPGQIVININPINAGVIGSIGNNNSNIIHSNKYAKEKKRNDVKNWIGNNPPKNKELKMDYYNRYLAAGGSNIGASQFAKLVIENTNYSSFKSNGNSYWIPASKK